MPLRTFTAAASIAAAFVLATPAVTAVPAVAETTCATGVFGAGTGGYDSYRIPALVNAGGGVLLAFAEGRRNSAADSGDIDIVLRRSLDGGCTWLPHTVVTDAGPDTADNPVPMVTDTGKVVLVSNGQAGDVSQAQILAGQVSAADGRRVYVQTSADQGATWTARRDITATTKRAEWLWYATGPGHGLTIERGLAVGRLVVAADHSEAGTLRGVHTILSDDDGATWRIGGSADHTDGQINPDETTATELLNARLYFSARDQGGTDPATRATTYSTSSGSTLAAPFTPAPGIVTPVVENSVLQDPGLPDGVSCHPLLYSAPEDPAVRQNLTIRRSDDDGATWRTVTEVTAPTVPAAYSDIVKTNRTTLGVLFETGTAGPYERIDFRRYTVGCP